MNDYRSLPDSEHVRRWSEDADRITGEVARHLAVVRARISAAPITTLTDFGVGAQLVARRSCRRYQAAVPPHDRGPVSYTHLTLPTTPYV